MTRYTSRTEAIQREIIAAIEASGVANAADFNIEAIADETLSGYEDGYAIIATPDEFWAAVQSNEI